MLSERDEIAGGDFHYCVWRMRYGARGKNQGLNEGTDLCQRLAVNALGQRWIRTQTHTHTTLSLFFCCNSSHLGLNSSENVSLVLCFRDVGDVTETTKCTGIELRQFCTLKCVYWFCGVPLCV